MAIETKTALKRTYVEAELACDEVKVRLVIEKGQSEGTGQRRCRVCGQLWDYRVERAYLSEFECDAFRIYWKRAAS